MEHEERAPRDELNVAPATEAISVLSILAVLLRERRVILACAGLMAVLALVFALSKQRTYSANFSFVPQQTQDPSLAGLASLAGQFGVSLGGSSAGGASPQLYADLLKTREVLVPIAKDTFVTSAKGERVSMAAFFEISGSDSRVVMEKTLRKLRAIISASVATRTTGMVSVTVSTRSPSVSLQIAQRLMNGVNDFYLGTRRTQASEERRFTEGRLAAARVSLRAAEDALERFLLTNRQFSSSPQLTFQRDRLQREVSLQQQIVVVLAQGYEEARIREVRDTPVITVIEHPILAAQSDPRGSLVTLIIGTVLGLFLGVIVALLRNVLRRLRATGADPAFADLMHEWQQLRLIPRRAPASAER